MTEYAESWIVLAGGRMLRKLSRRLARNRKSVRVMTRLLVCLLTLWIAGRLAAKPPKLAKPPEPSALDEYVEQATRQAREVAPPSPGSLWQAGAPLSDLLRRPRARPFEDPGHITLNENLSAPRS